MNAFLKEIFTHFSMLSINDNKIFCEDFFKLKLSILPTCIIKYSKLCTFSQQNIMV